MRAALVLFALALAGCSTLPPDGGMGLVEAAARADLGADAVKVETPADADRADARLGALLKKPLTAASAVQIALLNNRGLQAAYNDLGISSAQFAQASLPPSPTISLSRLAGGLELEIERQILVNLLGLLTLPARKEIAAARFRQAQFKAIEETLKLAAETQRAYYNAVASRQTSAFLGEAAVNARTVSQLFRKLAETGAAGKLDQAREHVFYAEIAAQLARARMEHEADREKLTRLLGLWGPQTKFTLPAALPALPKAARNMRDIEREAIAKNIQIALARAELDANIKSLGLTEVVRYVNIIELRGMSVYDRAISIDHATGDIEKDKVNKRGLELELQIPIFDFGAARTREAEETYRRSVNQLAARAVDVRSIARESYQRYRGAYDLAGHYRRSILPLRKIISDESLLRYNAMIVDIIPVLAEARQRLTANIAAIQAQRDFWLAHAGMRAAVIGGGAGGAPAAGASMELSGNAGGGH